MSIHDTRTGAYRRIILSGHLVASPLAGEVFAAEEDPYALIAEEDYWTMLRMEKASAPPVMIDSRQHYRILTSLITAAFTNLPKLDHLFLGFFKRSVIQVPAVFLDPRVLILNLPAHQIARLISQARREILIVGSRLTVTGREFSDNTLRLELFSAEYDACNLENMLHSSVAADWLDQSAITIDCQTIEQITA